jgi:hypothetical protein
LAGTKQSLRVSAIASCLAMTVHGALSCHDGHTADGLFGPLSTRLRYFFFKKKCAKRISFQKKQYLCPGLIKIAFAYC